MFKGEAGGVPSFPSAIVDRREVIVTSAKLRLPKVIVRKCHGMQQRQGGGAKVCASETLPSLLSVGWGEGKF